jgi:hypothetical protein
MRTHDPFLRHLLASVDRCVVLTVLAIVMTALAWTAAWECGLGMPALDGWQLLAEVLLGRAMDSTALTMLALCAELGITSAMLVSGWRHAPRKKRQHEQLRPAPSRRRRSTPHTRC